MRRITRRLAAGLCAALLLAGTPASAGSREGRVDERASAEVPDRVPRWWGPCDGYLLGENLTPAFWTAHPGIARHRLGELAECVFERFAHGYAVPAWIIERESGWNPWAANPADGSSCRPWTGGNYGSCGLAQHLSRYWEGRLLTYGRAEWFPRRWPHVSPFDPRANLIAMARMYAAQGGACPAWC